MINETAEILDDLQKNITYHQNTILQKPRKTAVER